MNNNISIFDNCANCGACENICPVGAIHLSYEGIYYSMTIDEKKCINCGKCISVCPVNKPRKAQNLVASYAGYVDNNEVLFSSSSGGAFHVIAKMILEKGGVVYAAGFDEKYHVVQFYSTDEVSLRKLQKSKYVEGVVGKVFQKIQNDLRNDRHVLFCGTPCQAAGLRRYLDSDYKKLVVCDFACGGLPSHKMYDEYLNDIEKKYGSNIEVVDFRPKNFGWDNHSIYIKLKNGKVYTKLWQLDSYYKAFLNGLSKRDYCYKCDFADNHYSDLILADFWRFKDFSFDNNKQRGLSLLITNSVKGEKIVRQMSEKMQLKEVPLAKASYNIKSGHMTEAEIEKHKVFIETVEKEGFVGAVEKAVPASIKKDWKFWIVQIFKRGKYEGSKKTGN
jgi:coenzyme F420-reducing hydrogenase beta subunit